MRGRPMFHSIVLAALALGCGTTRTEEAPPPPVEPEPAPSPPPSILLITSDTTRADHLGAWGYGRATSPTIDRLAREGVRAENAITTMPTTDPAHLSILTGLYPRSHGVRRNGVRAVPDLDNLARWAGARGRTTAAFVSRQHVRPSELGLAGFDHEDGPSTPQRPGGETLARALEWLADHGESPYFLWVHFFDPHRPYAAPEPFARRFVPEGVTEVPATQRTAHLTPDRARLFEAQYDAEIAYTDSLVARLLAAARDDDQNPLVVLAADHGEHMDELWERHRFVFGHGKFLHAGSLHVPLVFHWPGHLTPRVVSTPVSLVDVSATVFAALGEPGFEASGRDILEGPPRARTFIERCELDEDYRTRRGLPVAEVAVRDAQYHLILSSPGDRVQLYDHRADPLEERNLAEAQPEVVSRMRAALDAWHRETPAVGTAALDPQRIEALRALGYIE
ncbi:MAG: sulfatase [Sandaracinaceae bacterium]